MKQPTDVPVVHSIMVPMASRLDSVNFYLVESGNSLILLDAGFDTEECWVSFEHVLQDNGWKVEDIDKIVLTHDHNDHRGLVNRIRSITKIPVYAHPDALVRLKRDATFMEMRIAFFKKLYEEMGCGKEGITQVDKLKQAKVKNAGKAMKGEIQTIQEGDTIDGFHVLDVPGHAPGHIALLHRESGILLAGDHIIPHMRTNAIIEPDHEGKMIPSLSRYYESLEKCREYPLSTIYPGHGEIVDNPDPLIVQRLQEIEDKGEKIRSVLKERPRTAAEVAKMYYKEKYETQFSLVMSQVIGHLERLVALNKIAIQYKHNVWYYSLVSTSY